MKPREFWVREAIDLFGGPCLLVYDLRLADKDIHVREVVPIDWEKVWKEYGGAHFWESKEQIQELIEKQLVGEE